MLAFGQKNLAVVKGSPAILSALADAATALGQADQALAGWRGMVDSLPQVTGDAVTYKALALKQMGRVLETAQADAAAEEALRQSLDISPEQPEVIQHWLALRQRQCKWPLIAPAGFSLMRTS